MTKQSLKTATNDGLNHEAIKAFKAEAKVGILATINPDGLPHLTLITSLQAKDPHTMLWGQFTEGMSKEHVRRNPKTAFLILMLDRSLWRGKALWTSAKTEGDDYDMLNKTTMFRYNAYFGIHTVHYMDIVEAGAREGIPIINILMGGLLARIARSGAATKEQKKILRPWAEKLFNKIDALKFISWIGDDGFPTITPVIQCRAADSGRIVFSPAAYRDELNRIPMGAKVAVFGMSLQAEDILVRGDFKGFSRFRGVRLGVVDIVWVYNSMPPAHGQIYPALSLDPVVKF